MKDGEAGQVFGEHEITCTHTVVHIGGRQARPNFGITFPRARSFSKAGLAIGFSWHI